jgi:protein subunit release factor B
MTDFNAADKEKTLLARMAHLGIREEDIKENFVRSSGPGGQNVNKTSTCVYLKHLPSGIEVKCQKERTQSLNRYLARKLLLEKIEKSVFDKLAAERQKREKIRRQKRRRSRAAKLRILESKRRQAQKKALRAAIRQIE